MALSSLDRLEAESIFIFREVVATCDNPVLLYSIGKDSSVLLHLARKAFYPGSLPFPLLHVDTTWKFRAMIEFRDAVAKEPLRELAEHNAIGGRGPLFVGSPTQVADAIETWIEQTGADGLNLSYAVVPESYADFATYVVPELQRRGRYKRSYAPGMLREKLYGAGRSYLPASHPGGAVRTVAFG